MKDNFIDETYIDGICCNLCKYEETDQCIVESASSWSRYKNFCSEFKSNGSNRSIREVFIQRLKQI